MSQGTSELGYISNTHAVSHYLKMIAQFCLLDFLEKNLLYYFWDCSSTPVHNRTDAVFMLQNMFNYVVDYSKPPLTVQH